MGRILALLFLLAIGADADVVSREDTIGKVTKILKEILKKNKEDGDKDRELFAKFRCYCDTNTEEKTESVDTLTKQIKLLGSELSELQADTGKRSAENGELSIQISENEAARTMADSVRDKDHKAFEDEETDLTAAIDSLDQAIDTLSAIGADMTAANADRVSGADTGSFLKKNTHVSKASMKMLGLKTTMNTAFEAASALLSAKQRKTLTSFIQAPFGGAYQSQSGEIVGILKNMRDTFKSNLADARQAESTSDEDYNKFSKVKTDNFDKMKKVFEKNEEVMGTNDDEVATKKTSKAEAEVSLLEDSQFLEKLTALCAKKTKEYEKRKMIRSNEEAAVAQGVSILNSEEASAAFGDIKATTEGGTGKFMFMQISKHNTMSFDGVRPKVQHTIQRAAMKLKSLKLAKIAVALEKGNPFEKVVKSIEDMVELIAKEEKADDEQKAWCDSEREEAFETKKNKEDGIEGLIQRIDSLSDTVNNEETGLKAQKSEAYDSLKQNRADQKQTIKERKEEILVYHGVIENLHDAEKTLMKATKVLKKYYDWLKAAQAAHHYDKKEGKDSGGSNIKRLEEASVEELEEACSEIPECKGFNTNGWLKSGIDKEEKWYDSDSSLYVKVYEESLLTKRQKKREEPAPPDTMDEDAGDMGKGNDVVSMLEYIYDETVKEENGVHMDEEADQHAFESEMTSLKDNEKALQETIVDLEEEIAEKENDIETSHTDREATELELKETERYIEKIKPGCDFITENIEMRKESRTAETEALNGAMDALKGTPSYKEAAAEAEAEALGECAEKCVGKKEDVECKACLAGTSVTGYCAAHKDHAGC
jgi:ribosomal protein L14E/L6E/L27E